VFTVITILDPEMTMKDHAHYIMYTEINVVSKMWKYGILKMKIGLRQVLSGVWSFVKHIK